MESCRRILALLALTACVLPFIGGCESKKKAVVPEKFEPLPKKSPTSSLKKAALTPKDQPK